MIHHQSHALGYHEKYSCFAVDGCSYWLFYNHDFQLSVRGREHHASKWAADLVKVLDYDHLGGAEDSRDGQMRTQKTVDWSFQ